MKNHGDDFCIENGQYDLVHDEIKIIPQNESQEISENIFIYENLLLDHFHQY